MRTMIDALQTATQEMHSTDARVAKDYLAYTLNTGLTCLLVLGVAFCMNIGFELFKGTPKMDDPVHDIEKASKEGITHEQSRGIFVNDTVRRYHELQLEELESYRLTHTEQNIAILILLGKTNKDIAEKIHMAESTVKKYVQKILIKTGTTNRKEFLNLIQNKLVKKPN